MRKVITLLLIVAVFLAFPALAEENLISNPGFDAETSGWYRDMWYTDVGVSHLDIDESGYDGACIRVYNASENDARFCQDISVEPDTLYEITCMARAEGISESTIGANISVKDTFSYSDYIYDTHGEWVQLRLYGRTGEDQTSLTLCARVGGYSGLNTGSAWFDSFTMREIDALPADGIALDFAPMTSSASISDESDAEEMPPRYTEAWLLASFGIILAAVALMRKPRRSLPMPEKNHRAIFAVILLIAFVARLVIACMVRGYNTDINCFMAWSERMYANGFGNYYSADYFCDYPPLYMAMLAIPAAVRHILGIAYNSQAHVVLIKLMPMAFDIALAVLVYSLARRRVSSRAAMLLGAVCALNPASLVDSAAWGQIDSVFTFFTLLAAAALVERRYALALPMIAAAVLIKPQALLFAPLGLFAIIWDLVTCEDARKKLRSMLSGLAIALAALVAAALIFHEDGTNPILWLKDLFFGTMNSYPRMTLNAFNLYEMLGMNWDSMADHSVMTILAWMMFALSYLYSFALYARSRRPSALYLAATVLIMCVCAFGPMIHERYVYPAIILLLAAYACEKDRRLLISLTVLTVTLFMNQLLVLQGGMTEANYGHLQSSEDWLNCLLSLATVANALFTAWTAFSICFMGRTRELSACAPAAMPHAAHTLFSDKDWRLNLKRADYIIMAAVTAAYSILTFVNLGSTKAPQTSWVSSAPGESVVIDLGDVETWRMEYYGGICNSTFTVELSNDGETWTEPYQAVYSQGDIFRWLFYVPSEKTDGKFTSVHGVTEPSEDGSAYVAFTDTGSYPYQRARYVRLTAESAGLTLSETGFLREDGSLVSPAIATHTGYAQGYESDPALLLDEQSTVPDHPSYYNSSYFDEIYHARTAYEHLHGLTTYEWTHPPLGKVLMMVGIKIFGMTPFGWRFMGALMGVFMLPLMYLIVKQLGGSRRIAALAMTLLTLDSMHFTQTRIATIDSYAVFFIMLMYLFMFRYIRMSFNRQPLKKTLVPLILCGITMGLAWATKWIGIYASAGLAILFFWSLARRFMEYLHARKRTDDEFDTDTERARIASARAFWPKALITLGVCVIFFIIVPLLIYYFSYYWHMQAAGGLTVQRVVALQQTIFNYHSGLGGDTHYFRSPWYEWPVIAWPMWYYSGTAYQAEGMISSISCMGNPAVWWTGLAAIIFTMCLVAWQRRSDDTGLTISVGFLSQYLPWVLVPRSTFIYHYFASVPFIIMATAFLMGRLEKRSRRAFAVCAGILVCLALILFIMFYPLESGMPVSRNYAQYLRWFDWYNY